jgi:uncharacterized phiE125 gp8 family phage protein
LTQDVAPTEEPLTLAEAVLAAKAEEEEDYGLLASMLSAARIECENAIGRQLLTATYSLYLDAFPSQSDGIVRLPRPPLQSISTVKYRDDTGTWITLVSGTDYDVMAMAEPGFVVRCYGTTWPVAQSHPLSVQIQYVCGWAAKALVPENIRQWVRLRVATLYENREVFLTGMTATMLPARFADGLLDDAWIRDVD